MEAVRPPSAVASPGTRALIVLIKLIHSLIFLANSAAILYIFASGLTGRGSRWLRISFFLAIAECVVFVVNRGRCPLTIVVEQLGAEDGRVSDIFLPRWFADRIPYLCTPPLVVGAAAWLVRWNSARPFGGPGGSAWQRPPALTKP